MHDFLSKTAKLPTRIYENLRLPEVVDKPQEVHQESASDTRRGRLE